MPLSKKQKQEPQPKTPVKLTRAEKKEIQAIIRKYKGDGRPHSAQESIPYEAMYQDGVCRVTANTFSKCIEFLDISYQLAQADTKTAVFENLCDLYNYLDASIHVQFSFVNRKIDPKQYAKSFEIKAQGDDFDDIRAEYSGILQDQLVNGNNGLQKRKFLTFTIEADSLKMARARLRRIETDLLGYFRTMGAVAWVLDAKERLEVMHSIFHPDGEPFQFDWKWLAPSGLSTKDFIAPSSFRFGNARMFGLGGKYGAVSFLQILSPELSDEMLADFLNTENGIVVNLHVQAIDQGEAIKTVKRKITDLDAMKIQEQKRAVRSGYDMDILPSDLATYGQDAKELLKTLQSRNERMFQITFLVLNTADTRQKLENEIFWASGVAQKYNNSLVQQFPCPAGLPAGTGPYEQPAAGGQPHQNRAFFDDFQRGRVRPVRDAGAFSGRQRHVLRHQRQDRQHDYAGQKTGALPQRFEAGDARQRQVHELQIRDFERVPLYAGRRVYL